MTGKLTIGYTLPDPDSGYQPTLDGYRPGAAQRTVELDLASYSHRWPGGRAARSRDGWVEIPDPDQPSGEDPG
jgi:hypothetical protein